MEGCCDKQGKQEKSCQKFFHPHCNITKYKHEVKNDQEHFREK